MEKYNEKYKYKSSEISKILGISVDTLRYFEKAGIISPTVNPANNYRYYDSWDITFLVEYKFFRSMEYSMSEVIDIQQRDNVSSLIEKISSRTAYFRDKKVYYTNLEKCNQKRAELMQQIPEQLNKIYFRHVDAIDYFYHRHGDQYNFINQGLEIMPEWLEYFSFLNRILHVSPEWFENAASQRNCYDSGFSIETEYADIFQLKRDKNCYHLPACEAVCTIVRANGSGTFSLHLLDELREYIESNHLKIQGEYYANVLARTHEEDGFARFWEFFVPLC